MNKKIVFLILLAVVLFSPIMAHAINDPTTIIDNIKIKAVSIGEAIVVIGWIIAGILYLTAAGAPEKIKIAKGAMIACVVGTILVVIAAVGYEAIKALLDPILGT